ncbi:MAG: nitrate reductase molybdenum cofactor assembly chaperone [Euryarchaeota archaeon]|nr:nitrate reductase molybdenum cofactor assembly chaperone [Euryarchaeota archaeon]
MTEDRRIYALFADLLAYPQENPAEKAKACLDLLRQHPRSAAAVQKFLEFAQRQDLGRLQEVYTHTFDLNPVCSLYIGYHLYGESFRRGDYMVRLKGAYRARGLDPGNELPDHLTLIFRYLSASPEGSDLPVITEDVVPAIEAMAKTFEGSGNAYGEVVGAVKAWLEGEQVAEGGV